MTSVPDMTLSPIVLYSGTDSPVIAEASISASPLTTTPSAPIRSPVRITKTSPETNSLIARLTSRPARKQVAGFDPSSSNNDSDSRAVCLARFSMLLPNNTSVITSADASK